MQTLFSLVILCFLSTLTSCAMMGSSPKEEKHQLELTLHRIRTDLEEIKHDLSSYQMQLQIIEGQMISSEDLIIAMKERFQENQKTTWSQLEYQIGLLEKKSKALEAKQDQITHDLSHLNHYASDTTKALAQYKEKIKEMEKSLILSNELADQAKVKRNTSASKEEKSTKTYVVRSGDSLDKIARLYETSTEELKRLNQLTNDLIMVGQELIVPAPHS
jgi:LysM repeat protein